MNRQRRPRRPPPLPTAIADQLPAKPGTYLLLLHLSEEQRIAVGRLGEVAFAAGYYLYVGSALGPGGVRGRLLRHLRPDKPPHWHIDYLRDKACPLALWFVEGKERLECLWRARLQAGGWTLPVRGFGASDCFCPAHLLYAPCRPDPAFLSAIQRTCGDAGRHVPLTEPATPGQTP